MNTRSPKNTKGGGRSDPKDRRQVSLMHVFRAARTENDARKVQADYHDGAREMTARSKERRTGTDEGTLRKHLSADLASLMNTINLDAVVSLEGAPYVARSIVNYGFGDMSNMSDSQQSGNQIARLIRETLIEHEPRLIADTIEIELDMDDQTVTQRLSFNVAAEMASSPVDIPLDFVAEVDMGAGKIQMTRLRVQT